MRGAARSMRDVLHADRLIVANSPLQEGWVLISPSLSPEVGGELSGVGNVGIGLARLEGFLHESYVEALLFAGLVLFVHCL